MEMAEMAEMAELEEAELVDQQQEIGTIISEVILVHVPEFHMSLQANTLVDL